MKHTVVSEAKCYRQFCWKNPNLERQFSAAPWMSLISLHWMSLPSGCWVGILEMCSHKRNSWAIWAFSTLPAICGEKEFLSYVNPRGRSRWLSAVCTAAPGASAPLSLRAQTYLRMCRGRVPHGWRRRKLG